MPSVAMNPFFEELAFNYPDALFLTVDVDEVKEVAAKMEIKAMPTFLLMKNGYSNWEARGCKSRRAPQIM
ncbi:Thioredoxin-like protein CXXS1, partial [Cucurbita argyrosperma subsp. sororia]